MGDPLASPPQSFLGFRSWRHRGQTSPPQEETVAKRKCNRRATRKRRAGSGPFAEFARFMVLIRSVLEARPHRHLPFHGFAAQAGYGVWNPETAARASTSLVLPLLLTAINFPRGANRFRNGNGKTASWRFRCRNPFKKKNLIFSWLGHCNAITPCMRHSDPAAVRIQFMQSVRRVVEYAIALGAALLASYLILQGRW